MSDQTSLEARINALEQAVRPTKSTARRVRTVAIVGLSVLCGLLSVNLWLVSASLEQLAQQNERQRQHDKAHQFWLLCHDGATAQERTTAFLRLIAGGNVEWRSARLSELQLHGVDLSGADLRGADLRSSDLSSANLAGVQLDGCSLQLVDLTEADLSKANMAEASLLKAQLHKAKLREANLRAASLEQADARDADFVLADLAEAHLLMADLTGAKLTAADLSGANLEAAVLKDADLTLTRLTDANLLDADLTDCKWWRARGLSTEVLAGLREKFAPSDNTDPAWQDDYQRWLGGGDGAPQKKVPR